MNLTDLQSRLADAPADAALVFATPKGDIGGGYHVTELRHADVTAIDCAARVETWTEATMQLLDGNDGYHLRVGRFRDILEKSLTTVDGLGAATLRVEFANANQGLGLYRVAGIEGQGGRVLVTLDDDRAVCRPGLAAALAGKPGCCTGGREPAACCA